MAKFMLLSAAFFAALFALKASSQDTNWVGIDCGSEASYRSKDNILWQADGSFIKTGKNMQVSRGSYMEWQQLNTLRVFTQQNKNCYSLPTPTLTRYFFRAVFYYGNYDGLSKPPSFDLEIDGNKWTTVVTSMVTFVNYEVIYPSKGVNTSVCLARTQDKQFPFISILEAWPVPNTMYAEMSRDLAWLNSYRYNYGATYLINGYPEDDYNRFWEPMIPAGLNAITADFTTLEYTTSDFPPDAVMIQAVESQDSAHMISLPTFAISKANSLNRVYAYFTERFLDTNETRSFNYYINSAFISTIVPEYRNCTEFADNVNVATTLKVELQPTVDSTWPPLICAIEIYTASDPLVTMVTSQDDLDGLAVFTSTFKQLGGWSGDPCLPSDTPWQWLTCTGNDPPRVVSINLSGYGLDGPLPDFSQMKDLENVDLSNNSFDGPIPEFLGNLPNLKLLDLSVNNFSGYIPQSITNNKKIKCNVKENPNINHKGKHTLARTIGLAVGITCGVVVTIALAVFFILRCLRNRKAMERPEDERPGQGRPPMENESERADAHNEHHRPAPAGENDPLAANAGNANQNQGRAQEDKRQDGPAQDGENHTFDANAGNPSQNSGNTNQPSHDNEHIPPMSAGEDASVSVDAGSSSHPPAVSNMDMEELDMLSELQGRMGANGRA